MSAPDFYQNESDIYYKVKKKNGRQGMIKELGIECFATLHAIAHWIDDEGKAYPTQVQVAELLGIDRKTANKYINRLLEFRWDGKPILICEKNRNKNKGQFANNVYYFTAESGFGFGNDNQAVSKDRDMVNETVGNAVGNTMSTYRDTKKNYNFKKNKNLKKNILLEMNNGISEGMTVERNSIKEEDEDLERVLRGLGGRLAEGS